MEKGKPFTSESLKEDGWIKVCDFLHSDLEVWAKGTMRAVRRVKNEIIILLYNRKDYTKNLTKPIKEEDLK